MAILLEELDELGEFVEDPDTASTIERSRLDEPYVLPVEVGVEELIFMKGLFSGDYPDTRRCDIPIWKKLEIQIIDPGLFSGWARDLLLEPVEDAEEWLELLLEISRPHVIEEGDRNVVE